MLKRFPFCNQSHATNSFSGIFKNIFTQDTNETEFVKGKTLFENLVHSSLRTRPQKIVLLIVSRRCYLEFIFVHIFIYAYPTECNVHVHVKREKNYNFVARSRFFSLPSFSFFPPSRKYRFYSSRLICK